METNYKNLFSNYPDVVGVAELQDMLGIGRNQAYALLQKGTIKSRRIGKVYKILKLNVIKYLENI